MSGYKYEANGERGWLKKKSSNVELNLTVN